jgi:ATP-dependent DNA helicase RecQ
MAAAGLIDKGLMLSAVVHTKGKKSAKRILDTACHTEERLLKLLQEEDPDADDGHWVEMDVTRVNQRLRNSGDDSNPVVVRNLVKGLSLDGLGLAGSHGSIELRHLARDRYQIRLLRTWKAVSETAALRRNVAHVIVRELIQKVQTLSTETGDGGGSDALVPFSANDLAAAIKADVLLHGKLQKPLAAIDRSLMFLHENNVIRLQQGLAVFRQAMTIRLDQGAKGRRYTLGDYKPLSVHYRERLFQVHVMMEYAQLAGDKVAQALRLVLDYFTLPRDVFAREYFAGREDVIERATSAESYRQIVESLNNPIQIKIVGSPVKSNSLILAGPGSGKTRVVVHRCAYLLRVERVPASRILVMCFNHSAAVALRKRLYQLVGQEARGVLVATYHGAAMRIAGISLRELSEGHEVGTIDFDGLIRDAVALLKGETEVAGLEPDEARDQLLGGFSHILVDEYQDIDQDQYELVSAIAGRKLADEDGKLAIMAVGDDDQNVYAFRGANVQFIKQFEEDYGARTVYMVENYRSSGHIIAAANQLIAQNQDRMKGEHPIRVNSHRKAEPLGGAWEVLDPLGQGRVQRLLAGDVKHQAWVVLNELERLRGIRPAIDWGDCAVLARTHQTLTPVRALLEQRGVPFRRNLATGLPLHRVREIRRVITELKGIAKEIRSASQLAYMLPEVDSCGSANPWVAMLAQMHAQYQVVTVDAQLPVDYFIDWLYEALAEQRQEKTLGTGVFLNTIHSAKGMEFDHVFILDGDWKMPKERNDKEEERRALYVGMTRAKETLCLLELEKNGNPFLQRIFGSHVFRRRGAGIDQSVSGSLDRAYHLIGLKDLYLSYAGRFDPKHTVHQHLAALEFGHKVALSANGSGVEVHDHQGVCVAKFSKEGSREWVDRLDHVAGAQVIGIVQWHADYGESEFRRLANKASWEVPLLEIVTSMS